MYATTINYQSKKKQKQQFWEILTINSRGKKKKIKCKRDTKSDGNVNDLRKIWICSYVVKEHNFCRAAAHCQVLDWKL